MLIATFVLVIATAVSTALPYVNMHAIDNYINSVDRAGLLAQAEQGADVAAELAAQRARDLHGIGQLAAVMLALMLVEFVMRYIQLMLVAYVGQKTMMEMRVQIFAHLQKLSLRYLDKNPVGRLMTRVTTDVENIQESIVTGLVQVVSEIFSVFAIIGVMFWANWRLAIVAVSTLPGIFLVSYIFRKFARQSYLAIRKRIARLNAYMQEQVSGMRIIQLFNHETQSYGRFDQLNDHHLDAWIKQVRNYAIYFPAVEFFGSFSVALIIYFGGRQILGLDAGVASIGMLNAFIQWTERMFHPIRQLADKYNLLQAAMASSERIFNLLDTPEEIANKPDAVICEGIEGHIEFRDVWFAYEPEQWVLKGVSFTVAPGERVAIVGHTGAGKTTLISLLSRFYDVQRGAILVDGVDVRNYEKTSLRRHIGIVLQDVFLFSGSIRENIRLGDTGISDEKINACAQHVNAAPFIQSLASRYDYDVGERGNNLSTGQRQLLAFARTLAHDPAVLVLDEATSSVDTETEGLIQDAITKLMTDRTSIVIAHRLSTVQHADRIIVMHHGEIREVGNHQELLAERGLYFRLYQLQYKDQLIQAE